MRPGQKLISAVAFAAILPCGCASYAWVEKEVMPAFDHTFIRTIAVAEFENRSYNPDAGKIAADRLEELLVNESPYKVVTRARLARTGVATAGGRVDWKTMEKLGRAACVDALVVGAVEVCEFEEKKLMRDVGDLLVHGAKGKKVERTASVFLSFKAVNTSSGQVVCARRAQGRFTWTGVTETGSTMGPQACIEKAFDKALAEARALYPHRVKVRERVE